MHVLSTSHIKPVQSAGVELMCEVPLDAFASLPLQPLAPVALNPPPVGVYRRLFRLFPFPVAWPTIWLGYVGPHFQFGHSNHHLIAVIALVGNHFFDAFRM